MFLLSLFNSLLICLNFMIMVLISVAFLTLLERKILGYIQLRKGPNKVGFMGLFQPFSDAIKLFSKEIVVILKSNFFFFIFSPILSLLLMLLLWQNMPLYSMIFMNNFCLLVVLCLMSLGVYSMMVAGWSSNSLYSLIGGLRSVAQTVSYEVSMILIMLIVLFLVETFNLFFFFVYQKYVWFFLFLPLIGFIFYVSLLAELNRTPFDFAEGESELVSGFNTEYMSGSFAMIFIAEYGMIMFMMFLFLFFFCGGCVFKGIFYFYYLSVLFFVIWVRGTFPRFRYDNLMYLTWKSYLPVTLNILMFVMGVKFLIF